MNPIRRLAALPVRLISEHGTPAALLALCLYYSWATFEEQHPSGAAGGEALAARILASFNPGSSFLLVGRDTPEDLEFIAALRTLLSGAGMKIAAAVNGEPKQALLALQEAQVRAAGGDRLDGIACNQTASSWAVFDDLGRRFPALAGARIVVPPSHRWPNFLKADNLLNIANQIAVIAIIAAGMTLVIIAGGIDLSSGSLIALAAVVSAWLIREAAGAEQATALGMTLSCAAGIGLCAALGWCSGILVTVFRIPPFIATLSMMLVASGLAFRISQGTSIYQVPDSFIRLGRGADFFLPNAVLLMLLLYAAAHILLSRTALGRRIYATGGNPEAARLCGVPVRRVLLFVYTTCGGLAGLGGVVMASQLKSGSPTYGQMYELYVIAAVVVGGTSLSGGEGKAIGTLFGAFIIAVIQNGMNLTGVESYTQKVVLGLVILGAVLVDRIKRKG